jgi:hypothetical protein
VVGFDRNQWQLSIGISGNLRLESVAGFDRNQWQPSRGIRNHRAVKRITRPMLGFKAFDAAQCTLAGVELMHMIKKRQMVVEAGDEGLTAAALFYSLAA